MTARCCAPVPARPGTDSAGRGAGDVNFDGVNDLAIGSYLNGDGAPNAGKIELFSGRSGRKLRTITSTTR